MNFYLFVEFVGEFVCVSFGFDYGDGCGCVVVRDVFKFARESGMTMICVWVFLVNFVVLMWVCVGERYCEDVF